jgi:hypothetical protein
LASRRKARASGLWTFETARRKRLRSASGSADSSSRLLAIASSTSAAASISSRDRARGSDGVRVADMVQAYSVEPPGT